VFVRQMFIHEQLQERITFMAPGPSCSSSSSSSCSSSSSSSTSIGNRAMNVYSLEGTNSP